MEKITVPAKLENLEAMIDFILDGAKECGFDNKKIYLIRLCSEEALMNVISYAYPDEDGKIEITYNIKEGKQFVIKIIDWGVPFDPLALPEPDIDAPMEDRDIGGLGIYLIRENMDEVDYRRDKDRNILTLGLNQSEEVEECLTNK